MGDRMRTNIKDVAQKAGVSVTTVSRVMNNRGSLSEKTKEKVFSVMRELNYYPNQVAVNLFKKRTQLIGLIVPDPCHPFYAPVIKYMEQALSASRYKLLLCVSGDDGTREREQLGILQSYQADGIIITRQMLEYEDYEKVTIPLVALNCFLGDNIPTISSDHKHGGRLAAEELLLCGCKNVVQLVDFCMSAMPSYERNLQFEKIIKRNSCACKSIEIPANTLHFADYVSFIERILLENPKTDGIFANDNVACAVIKAAEKLNIEVPKQLRLVGYDGSELTLIPEKSVSTIAQNTELIAKTTAGSLINLINKTKSFPPRTHIRIPVRFIRRETSFPSVQ